MYAMHIINSTELNTHIEELIFIRINFVILSDSVLLNTILE